MLGHRTHLASLYASYPIIPRSFSCIVSMKTCPGISLQLPASHSLKATAYDNLRLFHNLSTAKAVLTLDSLSLICDQHQRQIDLHLLPSSSLVSAVIALNTLYTSFQLHFLYPLTLTPLVTIQDPRLPIATVTNRVPFCKLSLSLAYHGE